MFFDFLSVGLFTGPRGPLRVICILAWVHASPARILRGSLAGQRGNVVCVARGHAAPHSSLQVHPEAMWPSCVARVHTGPLGSTRVLEEARERV